MFAAKEIIPTINLQNTYDPILFEKIAGRQNQEAQRLRVPRMLFGDKR